MVSTQLDVTVRELNQLAACARNKAESRSEYWPGEAPTEVAAAEASTMKGFAEHVADRLEAIAKSLSG